MVELKGCKPKSVLIFRQSTVSTDSQWVSAQSKEIHLFPVQSGADHLTTVQREHVPVPIHCAVKGIVRQGGSPHHKQILCAQLINCSKEISEKIGLTQQAKGTGGTGIALLPSLRIAGRSPRDAPIAGSDAGASRRDLEEVGR